MVTRSLMIDHGQRHPAMKLFLALLVALVLISVHVRGQTIIREEVELPKDSSLHNVRKVREGNRLSSTHGGYRLHVYGGAYLFSGNIIITSPGYGDTGFHNVTDYDWYSPWTASECEAVSQFRFNQPYFYQPPINNWPDGACSFTFLFDGYYAGMIGATWTYEGGGGGPPPCHLLNQIPLYKQDSSAWRDDRYDTAWKKYRYDVIDPADPEKKKVIHRAGDFIRDSERKKIPATIQNLGCSLSCMAMVMTGFGDVINPRELNNWMKGTENAPRSYEEGGYKVINNGDVNWAAMGLHDRSKKIHVNDKVSLHLTDLLSSFIDAGLANCHLFIVNVGKHWVVVTGKVGNTYSILDPGHPHSLLSDYKIPPKGYEYVEVWQN